MNFFPVVVVVNALSNATGFYNDFTAGRSGCVGALLAVGYSASEVNASDFRQLPPIHSCAARPFRAVAEYVTGMNVTLIKAL
jgi:hypothetical protein